MTSDFNPPEPEEQSAADQVAEAKAVMQSTDWASPSGLVALAALIMLGVEIVFSLILGRGGAPFVMLLISVPIIAIHFGKAGFLTKIASAPVLLKLFGYTMGVYGIFHVLDDVRRGFHTSGIDWIELLAVYAAYAFALLGARGIKTD